MAMAVREPLRPRPDLVREQFSEAYVAERVGRLPRHRPKSCDRRRRRLVLSHVAVDKL
jgi:hypothetical protein